MLTDKDIQKIGQVIDQNVDRRFRDLKQTIDTRFNEMDENIEARFKAVDTRFNEMDENIEARFKAVDTRFTDIEQRLTKAINVAKEEIIEEFGNFINDSILPQFDDYEDRITAIEAVSVVAQEIKKPKLK